MLCVLNFVAVPSKPSTGGRTWWISFRNSRWDITVSPESMEKCGKVDRALAIIECALPNHGNDVIMVAVSARVYAVAQQWGLAVALWDRAIAMTGARPEWRDARAAVAERAALILSDADPTGLFPAAEALRPRREIAFPET